MCVQWWLHGRVGWVDYLIWNKRISPRVRAVSVRRQWSPFMLGASWVRLQEWRTSTTRYFTKFRTWSTRATSQKTFGVPSFLLTPVSLADPPLSTSYCYPHNITILCWVDRSGRNQPWWILRSAHESQISFTHYRVRWSKMIWYPTILNYY